MNFEDFRDRITQACDDARPVTDKYFICIDGKSHTLNDLPAGKVTACYASGINQKVFDQLCAAIDPQFLAFKGLRAHDLSPLKMSQH